MICIQKITFHTLNINFLTRLNSTEKLSAECQFLRRLCHCQMILTSLSFATSTLRLLLHHHVALSAETLEDLQEDMLSLDEILQVDVRHLELVVVDQQSQHELPVFGHVEDVALDDLGRVAYRTVGGSVHRAEGEEELAITKQREVEPPRPQSEFLLVGLHQVEEVLALLLHVMERLHRHCFTEIKNSVAVCKYHQQQLQSLR